jgi:hypothetical protein
MTIMSDAYEEMLAAIRQSQDPFHYAKGEYALRTLSQRPGYAGLLMRAFSDASNPTGSLSASVFLAVKSIYSGDRQMSYILLKSFVRSHWDSDDIADADKLIVKRAALEQMLHLPGCKPLLTQCSVLISAIAEFDLPTHQWPELMPSLIR